MFAPSIFYRSSQEPVNGIRGHCEPFYQRGVRDWREMTGGQGVPRSREYARPCRERGMFHLPPCMKRVRAW